MQTIERRIENIERMLKKLVEANTPEWISEEDAMKMLGRGKGWLKRERRGVGDIPATLIQGEDWRYVNGRTPEYKLKSIEFRKTYTRQKATTLNNA